MAFSPDSGLRSRLRVVFGIAAQMEQQRGVAAVIEDEVRRAAVVPLQRCGGY